MYKDNSNKLDAIYDLSYKHTNLYSNDGYLFKSRLCNDYNKLKAYYPSKRALQPHQQIPSNYFQISSKFRSLLVYLGTGLGKTVISMNIMNNLKLIHDKLNIIIMCPAALKESVWKSSIENWINNKSLKSNILFVSIDSPNLAVDFDIAIKSLSINSHVLFIIDECHIFTSSLVDETSTRRAVYVQLLNAIHSHNAYVVCLTATPVVNRIEELVYLFNILRANTFHAKEELFIDMFTNTLNGAIKNKHIFCKRITGLVSYFESTRKKDLPDTRELIVRVNMSQLQAETYKYAEKLEMQNKSGGYKQSSIAMCNFAPPLNIYKHSYDMRELIENASPDQLAKMSPKFTDIIGRISSSKRTNVIHSSYIESTIVPLQYYLNRSGYVKYETTNDTKNSIKKQSKNNMINNATNNTKINLIENSVSFKYAIVTGKTSPKDRSDILDAFNSNNNMYGNIIKILIISDAFSMGVTLKYAENICLLNYHWNMMKIFQAFGRIARLTTHNDLPPEERFVNQIIYVSRREQGGITADELLEKTAKQKDQKINLFLDLIKISSIDFEFNRLNDQFSYREHEPFRSSLYEIELNKPYITRSIMDEEGIFKINVQDLEIRKTNTRQINVVYVDDKQRKQSMKVLLIFPIYNYYIVDIQYHNYIGKLTLNENGKPQFDKETNYFIANVYI